MTRFARDRGVCFSLLLVGCLCISGCGDKSPALPETFPVTGTVTNPDGSPMARGLIQFELESNPSLNVSGTILDGKFKLQTSFGHGVASGVLPGRYRVAVTPAFESTPKTVHLAKLYEVGRQPAELVVKLP